MARERKSNGGKKGDWVEAEGRLSSPFAALATRKGGATAESAAEAAPKPSAPTKPAASGAKAASPPARAVLRKERKGRGGRTVTRVEKLGLSASEAQIWCEALRAQLGCGGTVEGDDLVFQGDQTDRIAGLLTARGVRKVIGP